MLIWPLSLQIWGSAFQSDDVLLLEAQFRSILNGDDPFRSGMNPDSTLSRVVLPLPVPPDTTTFILPSHTLLKGRHIKGQRVEAKQIFYGQGIL